MKKTRRKRKIYKFTFDDFRAKYSIGTSTMIRVIEADMVTWENKFINKWRTFIYTTSKTLRFLDMYRERSEVFIKRLMGAKLSSTRYRFLANRKPRVLLSELMKINRIRDLNTLNKKKPALKDFIPQGFVEIYPNIIKCRMRRNRKQSLPKLFYQWVEINDFLLEYLQYLLMSKATTPMELERQCVLISLQHNL